MYITCSTSLQIATRRSALGGQNRSYIELYVYLCADAALNQVGRVNLCKQRRLLAQTGLCAHSPSVGGRGFVEIRAPDWCVRVHAWVRERSTRTRLGAGVTSGVVN